MYVILNHTKRNSKKKNPAHEIMSTTWAAMKNDALLGFSQILRASPPHQKGFPTSTGPDSMPSAIFPQRSRALSGFLQILRASLPLGSTFSTFFRAFSTQFHDVNTASSSIWYMGWIWRFPPWHDRDMKVEMTRLILMMFNFHRHFNVGTSISDVVWYLHPPRLEDRFTGV